MVASGGCDGTSSSARIAVGVADYFVGEWGDVETLTVRAQAGTGLPGF